MGTCTKFHKSEYQFMVKDGSIVLISTWIWRELLIFRFHRLKVSLVGVFKNH